MTLNDLQQKVDQWIKEHGVRYFNEMTNSLILAEELGEFSRLMARKYGEQSFKKGKSPQEIDQNIGEELADILFVLTCLANQMGYSMEELMISNFTKKTIRDHKRHKANKKLSKEN